MARALMSERHTARTAIWARRLANFALVLFIVAGASHRFGLVETMAFLWLLGFVGAMALLAMLLAAAGFWRLWTFGDRAGRTSLVAVAVAAVVLAPYAASLWRMVTYPQLNDVATDTQEPPAIDPRPRASEPWAFPVSAISPEKAAVIAARYPQVTGRRYEATGERVAEAVAALVAERGWTVRGPVPLMLPGGEVTIQAIAKTFLLGFPVDVAIRVSDEGQSTYVDMRSASRYGRHDLGDNADRIMRFLADLDARMAADVGL